MEEYSEHDTEMTDNQGKLIIPATMTRQEVLVSILYSLTFNAVDVTDDDNLATTSWAQIHVSIALMGIVKKSSVEL